MERHPFALGDRYPKLIPMFPGIVAVARSAKGEAALAKADLAGISLYCVGMIVVAVSVVLAFW